MTRPFAVLGCTGAAVLGVLALVVVSSTLGRTHGHLDERLSVTVRVIDPDTGRTLDGALVAVVRSRAVLESRFFGESLEAAVARGPRQSRVGAARTTATTPTRIDAAVNVTRYYSGSGELERMESLGPKLLVLWHPRFPRTVVPIDTEPVRREGTDPPEWELDLGTVAPARRP